MVLWQSFSRDWHQAKSVPISTFLIVTAVTYSVLAPGDAWSRFSSSVRLGSAVETGEQFFSPKTVERLQQMILGQEQPIRVIETPVFEYVEPAT